MAQRWAWPAANREGMTRDQIDIPRWLGWHEPIPPMHAIRKDVQENQHNKTTFIEAWWYQAGQPCFVAIVVFDRVPWLWDPPVVTSGCWRDPMTAYDKLVRKLLWNEKP